MKYGEINKGGVGPFGVEVVKIGWKVRIFNFHLIKGVNKREERPFVSK